MSIASEITRLQNAKASLKTSINAKSTTQITNETLEDYASFVDNIPSGGGDYFYNDEARPVIADGFQYYIKKVPDITIYHDGYIGLFTNCKNIVEVGNLAINPSGTTTYSAQNAFANMLYLEKIEGIDFTYVSRADSMFNGCTALKDIGVCTNIGKTLRAQDSQYSSRWNLNFTSSTNLTKASAMNIINGLYDLTLLSSATRQKVTFASTTYALLSASDIAIATAKMWDIMSG